MDHGIGALVENFELAQTSATGALKVFAPVAPLREPLKGSSGMALELAQFNTGSEPARIGGRDPS